MSFDKTAIEEANRHLLAMNRRVIELGAMLNEKTVQLESIESVNQTKIEAITRQKDAEIEQRNAWLESTQAEIRRLKSDMMQKDDEISQLRFKASILDKISKYKPELTGLLQCLSELDPAHVSSPTPPVTTSNNTSATQSGVTDKHLDNNLTNGRQSLSSDEDGLPQPEVRKTKSVVWTPKAKTPEHSGDGQNRPDTTYKSNITSKIPGAAVKNDVSSESQGTDSLPQSDGFEQDTRDIHDVNLETQL